jgi:sugar (pentulose or hexulose) kinase
VAEDGPYRHCDADTLWRWLLGALAELAKAHRILAVIPSSYGSTAALIDDVGLVLPILDYEAEPPAAIAAGYAEIAPSFEECCCPINPGGLTLGRQLYWQEQAFPDAFARARHILPFAQYWAWRLSGVAAAEVTSLGAQTQLWNPRAGRFTAMAEARAWTAKLPPLRPAYDVLGSLHPEVAAATGLPPDTPVLCGIHDSNANFARYLAAGNERFTLVSTGTWLITFRPGLPLDRLAPARDMVSNNDLLGRPVACTRFMGGREYALVAGTEGLAAAADATVVERLIARGTLALPSFTDSGGPVPGSGGRGRIVGPAPEAGAERAALASLYVALMTDLDLTLLASDDPVIIDGGLAHNRLYAGILAALRPNQPVATSIVDQGTAQGAALLWRWTERAAPVAIELAPIPPLPLPGLAAYAAAWRAAVERHAG